MAWIRHLWCWIVGHDPVGKLKYGVVYEVYCRRCGTLSRMPIEEQGGDS